MSDLADELSANASFIAVYPDAMGDINAGFSLLSLPPSRPPSFSSCRYLTLLWVAISTQKQCPMLAVHGRGTVAGAIPLRCVQMFPLSLTRPAVQSQ